MTETLTTVQKKKMLSSMLNLQHRLNSVINPDWVNQNYNWDDAIMLEASELFESTPWKWWKDVPADVENIKVEVMDLIHFMFSLEIELYSTDKIDLLASDLLSDLFPTEEDKVTWDIDSLQSYTRKLINTASEGRSSVYYLKQIIIASNLTFEEIYKRYLIKNVLNIFRQDMNYNGNKSGMPPYRKHWIWFGAETEDNMVAISIADNLTVDEFFSDNLYNALLEVYQKES